MEKIRCGEVVEAVEGKLINGSLEDFFTSICTDSRNIKPGALFIPLKGERYDGHDYVDAAFKNGAQGALTHADVTGSAEKTLIRVKDTRKALGDIAACYRNKFDIRLVAITGSVGKTSTKDMVARVLAQKFHVMKTIGNFNNDIGLPLTMFTLEGNHEVAVVEMGMSGFGEISRLTHIAKPDIAVITNIGISHIEQLGSRNNILKAKMEILEGLKNHGIVILNGDDKLLYGLKGLLDYKTVYYGLDEEMDYNAYNVRTGESSVRFDIELMNKEYNIYINAPGLHNVYNALAAIAAGIELGIEPDSILEGISKFKSDKMRLNIVNTGKIKVIDDVYNSSPDSVKAAINVLYDMKGMRSIVVLGDMLELGGYAIEAHREIGKFAVSKGVDYIIAVGKQSAHIVNGALEAGMHEQRAYSFLQNQDAVEFLQKMILDGDTVLIKGSRSMKMEEIVNKILANEV